MAFKANSPITLVSNANAYEVAKAGGKYSGWLKQQRILPVHLLEKAIRSFEKLIAEHESWLEDPARKIPDFIPCILTSRSICWRSIGRMIFNATGIT